MLMITILKIRQQTEPESSQSAKMYRELEEMLQEQEEAFLHKKQLQFENLTKIVINLTLIIHIKNVFYKLTIFIIIIIYI